MRLNATIDGKEITVVYDASYSQDHISTQSLFDIALKRQPHLINNIISPTYTLYDNCCIFTGMIDKNQLKIIYIVRDQIQSFIKSIDGNIISRGKINTFNQSNAFISYV
jgi:uncharacterized metal-binding protein